MASKMASSDFIYGVYIPSAVMMLGVGIAAYDWLPYALVFPLALGSYQFLAGGAAEKVKALNPDKFQEFRLESKNVLSHNVSIYRFSLHGPHHILGLPIGQHMSVAANIGPIDEKTGQPKEIARSYTPISSDENPGYFDLLIKTYPQGNISKHMSTLKVGQTLSVKGPKGQMVYTPGLVRRFGMIAGGTGITPMLQIIQAISRGRPQNGGNDNTEVDLIFANVNDEDILLKNTLDRLAREDSKFRVHYVLNNPPENWTGGVGFVTADMIKDKLPAPANDIKILICGPPPMVGAMKKATESLGYDKTRAVSKLIDQVFCF